MNIHDTINLVAGLLQFVVAGYALRLNRIFGPDRVGWSLFAAFSLLAVLHLFQTEIKPSVTFEVMYSFIALLLLTSMAHIEALFKERLRLEQEEIRLRAGLEAEVEKKTIHLTRAIEALQAEIDERKRMEAEVEAHVELLDVSRRTGATETIHRSQMLAHIRF